MGTVVSIPDDLFREAGQVAAEVGLSRFRLSIEALRRFMRTADARQLVRPAWQMARGR
jgi:hypothetical protein